MADKEKILKKFAEAKDVQELKAIADAEPKSKTDKALVFAIVQAIEKMMPSA